MFKKSFERHMGKWEAKKRANMGDEAFLRKYVVRYPKLIKILQIILPVVIILSALDCLLYFIMYAGSAKTADLIQGIIWGVVTLIWVFVALIYFTCAFKIYRQKIAEWKKELETKFKPSGTVI